MQVLSFTAIDVVDTEERTCEGGGLAEGYKEGFVDLSLRINKDAAEEKYEASDREDKCCYELEFNFHGRGVCFEIRCKYIPKKGRFANFRPLFVKNSY